MSGKASRDSAAVRLAVTIVKAACFLVSGNWADGVASVADLIAGRIPDVIERRRIQRVFAECEDVVARKIQAILIHEFPRIPDNERVAAALAVEQVLVRGEVSLEGLIAADLDARTVGRRLAGVADEVLKESMLHSAAEELFRLILRESCAYMVEAITMFPDFQAGALRELLRRGTSLGENLDRVLEQLPQLRGADLFEVDYRRLIVNRLDRMELFGVPGMQAANRRYPLSVAFVSLGTLDWRRPSGPRANTTGLRVQDALAGRRRVLLIGEAGSGKTTLLRWLAVRAASGTFDGRLVDWNDLLPFFISLRQYADRALPPPEEFLLPTAANLASEMPPGWVHDALRRGRALVLVDGVDELRAGEKREEALAWLERLVDDFPNAHHVVTSRPGAMSQSWVDQDRFEGVELQRMSRTDVRAFVDKWHSAVAEELTDPEEVAGLPADKRSLVAAIEGDRYLRSLAVNPLLCAMLCALNREWRHQLPRGRMEVYSAALAMLLGQRDRTRGVKGAIDLSQGDQVFLLQDLAYWLVHNGWSDVQWERAEQRIGVTSRYLSASLPGPAEMLTHLRDRSGLLRELEQGRISFVHKTFQEYLAGKAAAEQDYIGRLIADAHDDQWREVIIMASGHTQPRQSSELIRGILDRSAGDPAHRDRLRLLALACMQTTRSLEPELQAEVEIVARKLIPPRDFEAAESLAGLGDLVLNLLCETSPADAREAAASVRAASLIGGDTALELISTLVRRYPDELRPEVLRGWRMFESRRYADEVLAHAGSFTSLDLDDPSLLPVLPVLSGLTTLSLSLPRVPLSVLGDVPDLRELLLNCSRSRLDLRQLTGCRTLERLHVHQASNTDFRGLDSWPPSLAELTIDGWPYLSTLTGIGRCSSLRSLTIENCAELVGLIGVESLNGLEVIDLSDIGTGNLWHIAKLPRLREVRLAGFAEVNLAPFAARNDLVIVVSDGARVTWDRDLGPGPRVVRT